MQPNYHQFEPGQMVQLPVVICRLSAVASTAQSSAKPSNHWGSSDDTSYLDNSVSRRARILPHSSP